MPNSAELFWNSSWCSEVTSHHVEVEKNAMFPEQVYFGLCSGLRVTCDNLHETFRFEKKKHCSRKTMAFVSQRSMNILTTLSSLFYHRVTIIVHNYHLYQAEKETRMRDNFTVELWVSKVNPLRLKSGKSKEIFFSSNLEQASKNHNLNEKN